MNDKNNNIKQEICWKNAAVELPTKRGKYLTVSACCGHLAYLSFYPETGMFNCSNPEEDTEITVQYWADVEGYPYDEEEEDE